MAFLREPRHHCCHKVKAVGSGGGEGGERCVFFGKTMATAISKGTAVHSEAMGKGKGLGHFNASPALKAAVPGPAALHGSLHPQSPLPTCARACWVSPVVLAHCHGLQCAQPGNSRPLWFVWHVQPLLACSPWHSLKGCQMCGMAGTTHRGEWGCNCLSRANSHRKSPNGKLKVD